MKIRKSFFIRWLLSIDEQKQSRRSVIDIEHVQTGDRHRVSTLEEATEWINKVGEKLEDEPAGKSI